MGVFEEQTGWKLNQLRNLLVLAGLVLLGVGALVGLTWGNHRFATENPGGNDFLVHWVGTRAFLMEGLSPYSDQVAVRIQTQAYGRPARAGEHELRVAYPLYSTVFFAPYALIGDYDWARALWMTTLEVALILTAVFSIRLVQWKPRTWLLGPTLLFAVLWYHSIRPLVNGNAVILVGLLLTLAFLALRQERSELAGALLALSTIKPHLVMLPIAFILLWAVSRRNWLLIGWTIGGVAVLSVLASVFQPNWILQNLIEVLRYPGYNPPSTPAAIFAQWLPAMGGRLGWGFSILAGGALLWEWVLARGRDFRWFLWTASITLVLGQWVGIQTDPGNYILLFPALVLFWKILDERWGPLGKAGVVITQLALFAGLWWLFLSTVEFAGQPEQHPIMFFPLPLFLAVGLYWVRWAALKPRRLWLDEYRARSAS